MVLLHRKSFVSLVKSTLCLICVKSTCQHRFVLVKPTPSWFRHSGKPSWSRTTHCTSTTLESRIKFFLANNNNNSGYGNGSQTKKETKNIEEFTCSSRSNKNRLCKLVFLSGSAHNTSHFFSYYKARQ